MIGPLDEFPLHQVPLPIGWVDSSDRNFYDRCYLNAFSSRAADPEAADPARGGPARGGPGSDDLFLITGLGYYPNLGTKDAFVLIRRGGEQQIAVHLGDEIDADRLDQRVGNYRIEVIEPLHRLRVILDETESVGLDLTWTGAFPVLAEQPHIMRRGSRITLQAQRFAQVGSWSGTIAIDGTDIAVDPDHWLGSRDRSWGIRPVGEPEPAGRPADPPFEGMWWLYLPLRFAGFAIVVILQEEPDGHRILNDCSRIYPDGRIEQLGWPRVRIDYRSGTRIPYAARLDATTPDGRPLVIELESRLAAPLHVGGGYGGDPDWSHGVWRGAGFVERRDYALDDPAVAARIGFGVIDHAARAVLTEPGREPAVGAGLFEHAALGRHDPTGFTGWLDPAP